VVVVLANVMECGLCGTSFFHNFVFPDSVETVEDIDGEDIESTEATIICPTCKHSWLAGYEGWHCHGDAGQHTMRLALLLSVVWLVITLLVALIGGLPIK